MTRQELITKLRTADIRYLIVAMGDSDAVHVDELDVRTAAQKKLIRSLVKTVKGDASDKGVFFLV